MIYQCFVPTILSAVAEYSNLRDVVLWCIHVVPGVRLAAQRQRERTAINFASLLWRGGLDPVTLRVSLGDIKVTLVHQGGSVNGFTLDGRDLNDDGNVFTIFHALKEALKSDDTCQPIEGSGYSYLYEPWEFKPARAYPTIIEAVQFIFDWNRGQGHNSTLLLFAHNWVTVSYIHGQYRVSAPVPHPVEVRAVGCIATFESDQLTVGFIRDAHDLLAAVMALQLDK